MAADGANASSGIAEVIDIAALLTPIEGDNPSGENTRYSGLHDEIREARRSEDTLAQGEWKKEQKTADWPLVESLSVAALTTRTKDLQIGAWMSEAIIQLYGFAGLRDGLNVMHGLLDQFWETIYPENDDGDLEGRANSLSWMDRQLATAIQEVNITKGVGTPDCNYLDFEDSKQFDVPENLEALDSDAQARTAALKERATQEGRTTSEDWRKAKATTRRAFYEELNALLNECWTAYLALDQIMDEKYARQTPGLGELKKSLDEIRSLIDKVVKEKRLLEPDPVEASAAGDEANAADGAGEFASGGALSSGPVRTRQEALKRLGEVAEYFRKTEPHSPVAYLVQRAIKWGNMPLESWLEEVIKDGGVLTTLRETLGLQNGDEGGG